MKTQEEPRLAVLTPSDRLGAAGFLGTILSVFVASDTPKRVAVVTTSYPCRASDAAGHFVASDVRALLDQGHHVTVLAPGTEPLIPVATGAVHHHYLGHDPAFGPPGLLYRVRHNPLRLFRVARFCARARRLLDVLGPFDDVVCHWLVPSGWPISCGTARSSASNNRHHATRLEWVAHGSDVRWLCRCPRRLTRRVLQSLGPRGRVRFVSEELRDALVQHLREPLWFEHQVAPSRLDLNHRPSRAQARHYLGFEDRQPLVILLGRLVPSKRTGLALRALAPYQALSTVVVGDGPCRTDLERRFPQARFTGQLPRNEALTWLAAADLLVSASALEGAPTAIREARELGVEVVSVAAGSIRQWAAHDPGLRVVSEPLPGSFPTASMRRVLATDTGQELDEVARLRAAIELWYQDLVERESHRAAGTG